MVRWHPIKGITLQLDITHYIVSKVTKHVNQFNLLIRLANYQLVFR